MKAQPKEEKDEREAIATSRLIPALETGVHPLKAEGRVSEAKPPLLHINRGMTVARFEITTPANALREKRNDTLVLNENLVLKLVYRRKIGLLIA